MNEEIEHFDHAYSLSILWVSLSTIILSIFIFLNTFVRDNKQVAQEIRNQFVPELGEQAFKKDETILELLAHFPQAPRIKLIESDRGALIEIPYDLVFQGSSIRSDSLAALEALVTYQLRKASSIEMSGSFSAREGNVALITALMRFESLERFLKDKGLTSLAMFLHPNSSSIPDSTFKIIISETHAS